MTYEVNKRVFTIYCIIFEHTHPKSSQKLLFLLLTAENNKNINLTIMCLIIMLKEKLHFVLREEGKLFI